MFASHCSVLLSDGLLGTRLETYLNSTLDSFEMSQLAGYFNWSLTSPATEIIVVEDAAKRKLFL